VDPKILQQLADAISSMASTQALMGYTLIVFAVGTLVCLGLLVRLTTDIHAQTSELLRRSPR
jgi:hypothetical protein